MTVPTTLVVSFLYFSFFFHRVSSLHHAFVCSFCSLLHLGFGTLLLWPCAGAQTEEGSAIWYIGSGFREEEGEM